MAISTTQIGTVTVPALVINFNGITFTDGIDGYYGEQVIGKVLDVPCREILYDNVDSWAIPVKDSGIFTGLDFELKQGNNAAQPTFDSFSVFRIRDKISNNYWIVYGTKADLIASCSTCCDGSTPIPMPGISDFGVRVAPCQTMDIVNEDGDPYMVFGLPTLADGETYFPYGSLNNVALSSSDAGGYADVSSLLSFLNADWNDFVWTASVDELTLTATGGELEDILCISVIAITPS